MSLLLKKKKLSSNQCESHFWGLCSFASLGFVSPCCWNFRRNTGAAWDGLIVGRTWLVPVCEMFQSCSSGSVVCCSYSGVFPFFQQSHDSQDAECERNCRDHNSFVLPMCLFCICFGFISLIVGFSLILQFMYGLSKMRLPQYRVLAYLLPALCECFGMYSPTKE